MSGSTRGGLRLRRGLLWLAFWLAASAASGQTGEPPQVFWVTPPAAEYVQDIDTQIEMAWEIRNFAYDLPHHTEPAFTFVQVWQGSSWQQVSVVPWQAVTGDGTFHATVPVSAVVYWPETRRYRVKYIHANGTPYYAETQTTLLPHAPAFVSILPLTVTIGSTEVVQIIGNWVVPTGRVPAGSPPLTVTVGGVTIPDGTPTGWWSFDSSVRPPSCQLSFVAPAAITTPGPKDVVITNPDGQSVTAPGAVTFVRPPLQPRVDSVTPAQGPTTGGTLVTVRGAGFEGGARVQFASEYATDVTVVNETELTCRTPVSLGWTLPVYVSVRNPNGRSGNRPDAFTYRDALAVTSVTPSTGTVRGGTTVTIEGTGFATTGTVIVVFGTDPDCRGLSVTVTSPTTLTCVTPRHVDGAVDVAVFNPDLEGDLLPGGYTYTEAFVSARFHERYLQEMVPPSPDFDARLVDAAGFSLAGTMDLTGLDLALLGEGSRFTFGTLQGAPGEPGCPTLTLSLSTDPEYRRGHTSFNSILAGPEGVALDVRLAWNRRRLWFSITGRYNREVNLATGTSYGESGYWLVAQNHLREPTFIVADVEIAVSFGNLGDAVTGTARVAYVATARTRTSTTPTGAVRRYRTTVTAVGY